MAVTHNRYKFVTVSLPKRLRNGRFTSETAPWIQKWFKISVGSMLYALRITIIVFHGGDERGYRNMCKITRRSNLKEGDWHITPHRPGIILYCIYRHEHGCYYTKPHDSPHHANYSTQHCRSRSRNDAAISGTSVVGR
jgi:hypothetical protein